MPLLIYSPPWQDYNLVEALRRQVAERHQRLAGRAREQAAELDRGAKERLGQVG